MDFLRLAERCEQADGPDPELDMLIACALKGVEVVYPTEGHPMTPGRGGRIESAGDFRLLGWIDPGKTQRNFRPYGGDAAYPAVTASIDAAMTLVPEGWRLSRLCELIESEFGPAGVPNGPWCAMLSERHEKKNRGLASSELGSTAALALCAAALRARDTYPKGGDTEERLRS